MSEILIFNDGMKNFKYQDLITKEMDLDDNLCNRHCKGHPNARWDPSWTIPCRFRKIRKNIKNQHFQFQKTDSDWGWRWPLEAETKTGDSSRYLLTHFLPDFLDVLKNLLGIKVKA